MELDTLFYKYEAVSGFSCELSPAAEVKYIHKVINSLKEKSK